MTDTKSNLNSNVFGSTLSAEGVSKLTLIDWLKIAAALDYDRNWGFYKWKENTDTPLNTITIEEWEVIATYLDMPEQWAYYRWKEFTNDQANQRF